MAKIDLSLSDCELPAKIIDPPDLQLIDAIQAAGLHPPHDVMLDGQIHRFASDINDPKDLKGWYVAYSDGIPAGKFGDHSTKEVHSWMADVGRELSLHEIVEHRQAMQEAEEKRANDRKLRQAERIKEAGALWDRAKLAQSHPYLTKKQIAPGIARIGDDGTLLLPIYSVDGSIQSLQRINNDGDKRFFGGAPFRGGYCVLGDWSTQVVYLVEGYATGSTVREKTGMTVVIAYALNNLETVYLSLKHKAQEWVLIADNDKSQAGQKEGKRLEEKHGLKMVLPGVEGQDANDFVNDGGDLLAILPKIKAPLSILDKLEVEFASDLPSEPAVPDEIIEGLIASKALALLYGNSNSGKTFFALSLAASVASGNPCYGRQVEKGQVIYLATEAPGSIRIRLQAIKQYYGYDLSDLAIVPVPLNFFESPSQADDVIALIKELEERKKIPVRMITADTLSRISTGANENTGEDMGPIMRIFDRIIHDTDASALIVHHSGKNMEMGARGWSGIRAHVSTELEVTETAETHLVTVTKQRELPGKNTSIPFQLHVMEMGMTKFNKPFTTCVAIPDDVIISDYKRSPKNTKLLDNMKILEKAWVKGKKQIRDGYPFVTRDEVKTFLLEEETLVERTIRNKLGPSNKDGIIYGLIEEEMIAASDGGWLITDPVVSSILMVSKR